VVSSFVLTFSSLLPAQQPPAIRLQREISLPGVQGRIDHLSADVTGHRVFISALGNGTVEVVDLDRAQRAAQIHGLKEPQGTLYLAQNGTLYVASGGDGSVRSYDAKTLQPSHKIDLGSDADNLRFDRVNEQVLAGYGEGGIAVLSPDLSRVADIKLPVHPESFQVSPDGKRLFVNLPENSSVGSIDFQTRHPDPAWAHPGALANFPMALDIAHERLLVACRKPPRLLVINTKTGTNTGAVIGSSTTVGDADDLFFDTTRGLAYVIGGEGYVDVVRIEASGNPVSVTHIPTAPGARTGLYVPEWNKLLVAAPHRDVKDARLLVFSLSGE
jgi:DNA-binding beta-propeller fold protein YncE